MKFEGFSLLAFNSLTYSNSLPSPPPPPSPLSLPDKVYTLKVVEKLMHSIKGGWVGQTFALAKRNESDGRKSRIRRSKEERKAMVESFIKKYQESNNGNFPSLNLTHKEVGGSFYTVREIVRDIIQENRVLGPAKFTLQELTSDQFFEHNPLGSIAKDPQSFLSASSIENHPEPNNLLDSNGKNLSVSNGYYTGAEHQEVDKGNVVNASQIDVINEEPIEATIVSDCYYDGAQHLVVDKDNVMNGNQVDMTNNEFNETISVSHGYHTEVEHQIVDKGQVINGSQVDVINTESSEATITEVQVSEPMALKQNEKELSTTATPVAEVTSVTKDLIVETFPLRPLARPTEGIEALGESRGSSNSSENDIKMSEMEKVEERSELNGIEPRNTSKLLDEKFEVGLGNQTLKNNSAQDEEKSLGDTLAENTKDHEFGGSTEPQVRVSHQKTITLEDINQSQMIDGAKTSIQDDFQVKNLTNSCTEGSKPSEESMQKANKLRVDEQIGGNTHKRSNTTLDRINLESWDGTTKNSVKQETNPLLAIFKAFVDAFVKFWSE